MGGMTARQLGIRAVCALVAALLGVMTLVGVFTAGTASAQPSEPPDAGMQYGRGYVEIVTENIDELCRGGAAGGSGGTDDTADPGLDGPVVGGAGCDLSDPALWDAVEVCIDEDMKAEPASRIDKAEFLECMATKGFGEEEKEETSDPARDEQAIANLSLARLSASLTSFYVNSLSPLDIGNTASSDDEDSTQTEKVLNSWSRVLNSPGSAGSFVGSPDRSKQESTDWLFSASDAANVSSVNYSAFNRDTTGDATGNDGQGWLSNLINGSEPSSGPVDGGVEGYLLYGAMLSGMGFDTMLAADGADTAGRSLSGLVMMAGYAGAGFVDAAFDSVVSVLQWINPFRFMVDAITENTDQTFTAGMEGSAEEPPGAFDGLREFFGTVYSAMVDLGWMVTIPLFIAMTFAGMLLLRKFDTGSKMKALLIRIAFLVIGLPLLGTSYTAGLDAMKGASGDAASAHATKVVLSTYVDFEAWVNGPRLQPPSTGQSNGEFWWNEDTAAPNGPTAAVARKLALNINASNRPVWSNFADTNIDKSTIDGNDMGWASSVSAPDQIEAGVNDAESFTATMELLNKFRSGTTVNAGAFESSIKAGLIQEMERFHDTEQEQEARATIASWFQELSSPEALAAMSKGDVDALTNPLIEVMPTASFTAGRDPSPDYSVMTFGRGESVGECLNTTVVKPGWNGTEGDDPRTSCNMSPLAMFNYLNTSFGPTSMDVYTPGQTTNSWAREAHASVSAIGTGPAAFMYWFSAITMLASFTIIGLAYAMMMLISSIKRGIQLIAAVPFATLGFVAGIAKCVIYTAAMFLEILGTIFIYKVVQELIVVVPTILERPLAERLSDGLSESTQVAAAAGAAGLVSLAGENNLHTIVLIITAVSSAGLIMFTMMALKIRRSLLDGMDQAVTRLVNKFMDTQASGGMDPGQPGALRQGVARGAGMAATSALIGGGVAEAGGDSGGDIGGGSDGSGPDGGGSGTPGVPGAGDGSMKVGDNGELLDKAGNPVVGPDGQPLTAAEMMPVDAATGNVHDGTGAPIVGEDGSPLNVDDVAGFDGQGRMLGEDGTVLTDANGQELTSQPAAATASRLAGDRAVASGVLARGLSDFPGHGAGLAPTAGQAVSQTPQTTVPVTESAPTDTRTIGGPLRSDAIANGGDSSILGHAAALTASSMVTQRLAGPPRRKPPEAMGASGKNPGSSGRNGGGGGSGPTGGSIPQRRGTGASTAMQSAAMSAAMRNRPNERDSEPPPAAPPAAPPRGN